MSTESTASSQKKLSEWESEKLIDANRFVKRFPPSGKLGFEERMLQYHLSYGSTMDIFGSEIEDIARADDFFFDEAGFREIHSVKETEAIIRPMATNSYGNPWERYANASRMFLIPTTEFIESLSEIVKNFNASTPLEIGAGDGTLATALSKSGVDNLRAIDDFHWGGRFLDGRFDEHTGKLIKSIYPIVEEKTIAEAMEEIQPDLVIMSWLVGMSNREDDTAVLKYPCVKNIIWIGSDDYKEPYWHQWYRDNNEDPCLLTSSNSFWIEKGWKRKKLPKLSPLHFTASETNFSFYDNYKSVRKPQGEVVVISRK